MRPSELKRTLMQRDDLLSDEADEIINEMKVAVQKGENPEEVLLEYVGLEPDYIFDII